MAVPRTVYLTRRYWAYAVAHWLDRALIGLAWVLSGFTPIIGAGAFYWEGHSSFVDVWTDEGHSGNRSMMIRLGRIELVFDYETKASTRAQTRV